MYAKGGEKRRFEDFDFEEEEEAVGSLCRLSGGATSPKATMEQEKKIRREIANSNERRRMQSINAGFASLKTLLPHNEGEKLSKAAILQQTSEYIYHMEQEKTRLLSQNCQLKRLLNQQQHQGDQEGGSPSGGESPNCDDDMTSGTTKVSESDVRRDVIEVRVQLDRERRHRLSLEEHIRTLEAQLYPDRIKEIAKQVKMDFQSSGGEEEDDEMHILRVNDETLLEIKPGVVPSTPSTVVVKPASTPTTIYTTSVRSVPSAAGNTSMNRQSVGGKSTATVVTLMQHNKVKDTLPTVLEALTSARPGASKVEVEPARMASPGCLGTGTTIQCLDENGKSTLYIVKSSSGGCQKSLDTICEAIRHLEGDHMFQTDSLEEEIVTDETLTIDEKQVFDEGPIVMNVSEPQDVPLELTTAVSTAQRTEVKVTSLNRRPGVIVVKQNH